MFLFYSPIACRKRKLEIQTEPFLLAPRQTSPVTPSPLTFNDTLNPGGSYYERRSSITSSGTESGSEGSPVTAHFSSPCISLPSLSSPQQSYDKLFPAFSYLSTLPPTTFDPTVKLPPIRHLFAPKRQKTEEDAVLAMMQLSQNSQRLF